MTATVAPQREPPEVRDFRFDLSNVPRYWHGGQRSVTLFFNNLSVFVPAGMLGLLGPYLSYYRPGFHPWEHDSSALLAQWKAGLLARSE